MTIKLTKPVTGYDQYKVGDVIPDAETIFGPAQARYLLETEYAEPVGETRKETATTDKK